MSTSQPDAVPADARDAGYRTRRPGGLVPRAGAAGGRPGPAHAAVLRGTRPGPGGAVPGGVLDPAAPPPGPHPVARSRLHPRRGGRRRSRAGRDLPGERAAMVAGEPAGTRAACRHQPGRSGPHRHRVRRSVAAAPLRPGRRRRRGHGPRAGRSTSWPVRRCSWRALPATRRSWPAGSWASATWPSRSSALRRCWRTAAVVSGRSPRTSAVVVAMRGRAGCGRRRRPGSSAATSVACWHWFPPSATLGMLATGRRMSWHAAGRALRVQGSRSSVSSPGLDYLRPEEDRSHLGRFVDSLVTGDAASIVQRKLEANVSLLTTSVLP